MTDTTMREPPRGSWIPWIFVAAFGVMATVNAVMIYFAATSATPLVTAHPYEEGVAYNEVLARGAAQDALGWRGEIEFTRNGADRGELRVAVAGRDGVRLAGLAVAARITRPIEAAPETDVALTPRGDGSYAVAIELPTHGQWQVEVTAWRGADEFSFARRIVVR